VPQAARAAGNSSIYGTSLHCHGYIGARTLQAHLPYCPGLLSSPSLCAVSASHGPGPGARRLPISGPAAARILAPSPSQCKCCVLLLLLRLLLLLLLCISRQHRWPPLLVMKPLDYAGVNQELQASAEFRPQPQPNPDTTTLCRAWPPTQGSITGTQLLRLPESLEC
jgi:hypothetical protein